MVRDDYRVLSLKMAGKWGVSLIMRLLSLTMRLLSLTVRLFLFGGTVCASHIYRVAIESFNIRGIPCCTFARCCIVLCKF